MRTHTLKTLFAVSSLLLLSLTAHADKHPTASVNNVLVILTADSLQTQGMALVLSNAMADQGANVNLLLCDSAGDLALKNHTAPALKPRNLTPIQMLHGLMAKGAQVKVCALYLPNSEYSADDLLEGVTPASPAQMAEQMLNPALRVFTF